MTDRGIHKVVKIVAVLVLLPLSIIIPTLSLESYYAPAISAQTDEGSKSFSERKKQYLNEFKEQLDAGQEQRIKLRCLAVQTNIKNLSTRVAEVQTKRKTAYDTIVGDVEKLTAGLKNQAFDTTNLEQNTRELKDKLAAYQKNMEEYKLALEDLTVIDCSKDPATFKAALLTARRAHTNLTGQVADIRSYILNSLKPTLQQVRQELVNQQATGVTQ